MMAMGSPTELVTSVTCAMTSPLSMGQDTHSLLERVAISSGLKRKGKMLSYNKVGLEEITISPSSE